MKKVGELVKRILENSISRIISIVIVLAIILFIVIIWSKRNDVDTKYLIGKLQKSSELTTAKLTYTGFKKFKDGGIVIINRSDFLMVYEATVRAGIDLKNVDVQKDKINKIVWVIIPKAEILDVKVNAKNITYYDEKFSLFNFDSKEDSNRAIAEAEEDAKKKVANMGILKMADDQAEALITGLLRDSVPEKYEIKIKRR